MRHFEGVANLLIGLGPGFDDFSKYKLIWLAD